MTTVVDLDPYLMRCALRIADDGMSVFPLRPGSKVPALGRGWQQRATTDHGRIRSWWASTPWNIGVATSGGLLVVDLDAPKARGEPHGRQTFARLAREAGEQIPRQTRTVVTPSGGQHVYLRTPAGLLLRNTTGTLGRHVDTRAEGGYVVGPGSVVGGRRYRITDGSPPAPMPEWLCDRLRPRSPAPFTIANGPVSSAYVAAVLRGEAEAVAHAVVGRRNATLFRAAARLGTFVAQRQLSEADVIAALERACGGFADFGQREIQRTIRSGLDRGVRTAPSSALERLAAAPNRPRS